MSTDILSLRNWYHTPVGQTVRRAVQYQIEQYWPDMGGKTVLALGYGVPYVSMMAQQSRVFCAMPGRMGGMRWPPDAKNRALLCWPEELPFPEAWADAIFLMHCLEFNENAEAVLSECFRVLKPEGRLLSIVPNRNGVWARREISPLASGNPYSAGQLQKLLQQANFLTVRCGHGLYVPPSRRGWLLDSWMTWEKWGSTCWAPIGGIVMADARKDVFSGKVLRVKTRSRMVISEPAVLVPTSNLVKGKRQ